MEGLISYYINSPRIIKVIHLLSKGVGGDPGIDDFIKNFKGPSLRNRKYTEYLFLIRIILHTGFTTVKMKSF